MKKFDSLDFKIIETEGVFTMKNINTTIGFVRFNEEGEIEYIDNKQNIFTKMNY